MIFNSISSLLSIMLIVFLVILPIFSITSSSETITVDLIHRDSPHSPFYDPSSTHHNRLVAACKRSKSRRQLFVKNSFSLQRSIRSHVISYGFELLMKVNIGTPPITLFLIADTGSDLIWMKSLPCTKCATKGRYITYNPKISSSYRHINCKSSSCVSVFQGFPVSCGKNNSCPFALLYGDGSQSMGDLGLETMGLGSNLVPNITFGLSHILKGSFPGSGIVGLASGPISLVRQLENSIGGTKFSYCLGTDKSSIGKISFGDNSIPVGTNVISTPMVFIEPDTFYYLTINSFSIGANGKKIKYGGDGVKGNIIIDSGTTLTYLPKTIFEEIKKSYMQKIKAKNVPDPSLTLDLCYKTKNVDKFPPLTVHFDGGSDLMLPPENAFVNLDEGLFCLNIFPFDKDSGMLSIYGNLWQENMVIGYDLKKKQVHFKPGGCPMYN